MFNIKIDYMRNHFGFFVKFFHLYTSGTPFSQLNSKSFQKSFWKILNYASNLAHLRNFKKIILRHCEKGLNEVYRQHEDCFFFLRLPILTAQKNVKSE